MNTLWWWWWKCVYTNIISATSLILNGRVTNLFDIVRHWKILIVSNGQNQRLIKRRRKNGLSTCVKDHFKFFFFSFSKKYRYEFFQWLKQHVLFFFFRFWLLYFIQMDSFETDWISNRRKKTHTWDHHLPISMSHVRRWLVRRLRRFCFQYTRISMCIRMQATKLCSALRSYTLMDQTQQEIYAFSRFFSDCYQFTFQCATAGI